MGWPQLLFSAALLAEDGQVVYGCFADDFVAGVPSIVAAAKRALGLGDHDHFLLFGGVVVGGNAAFGFGHGIRPDAIDIEQSLFRCSPR